MRSNPSDETTAQYHAERTISQDLKDELDSAEALLVDLNEKHADSIRKQTLKTKDEQWKTAEKNFDELSKLSDELDSATAELCKKYDRLAELATRTFQIIPEKDTALLNNSPLGPPRMLGALQLSLRKHGQVWAHLWLDDIRKIPTFRSTVENAKGWAFKMRDQE